MSVQNSYRQSWTAVLTGEHRPHWYPSHENDVSTTKNFNFIRTADGKRHLFKDLEVLIREADPEKPYTCIGQGQPYGDEKFCERYLCSTNGTSYCVMGHVEQYFMRTSVGDVPINAYGMQKSTAFERRMEIPEPEKTCEEWQPHCNPDGTITLFIQRKTTQSLHFCVEHRCQMMTASNGTTVHPPRSMRIRNTTYQIDCQETRNPHTKNIACNAADRCLIIRCLLCKEAWHNLDCVQDSLKLIALITFCASLTVILLEIVISRCYRCRALKESKQRKNASCDDEEIEMLPFRPRELTKLALPVLIVMILKIAEGCGEAVSLTAMSSHCLTTPEQRNCSFFESTMLTDRTRSTSCILLKDNHGEVMEHVEILTELRHRCIPRTLFWTLPTTLATLTVRRCPSAGSCQADACSRTQWNTTISEFGELNQEPGITRCEQAEGCITNGCFYCSPGCRFSKTTMLHANTTATEIITCTWAKEIFVRISGRDGILTQFVTSVGAPGTSILDGRIIVSATNFVSDMDENLPKTFGQQDHRSFIITERDGKLTEMVRCHHGKPDGHLRCTLNEELVEFKTADDMVHTHPEGNEELFVHMASTELPTRFDEVLIFNSHSGILAQGDGAVALQIDVQGYTAAVDTEMNFCTISEIAVTGCANCRQGARIDYNCSTSFGHPQLAVATCPSTTFTANCGSGRHENTYATILMAELDEMCSLRCPGGIQTFRLKASITYLEDYDEHWRFTEADEKKENTWQSYSDYKKTRLIAYDSELRHFVYTSRFHGPLRVYKSEHIVSLFWLICMIGSAVVLVLQLRSLIHGYYSHPVNANLVFEVQDDGVPFPQVTFCNFNPVRKSYLQALNRTTPMPESLVDYYFQSNVEIQALIGNTDRATMLRGQEEYNRFLSMYDPSMTVDNFFDRGGFDCSDLFMLCSFGGRKFDCCQFATPILTPLGKCYTLDMPGKGKPWMVKQLAAGEPNGLQVILDVKKDEVFSTSGKEVDPVFTNSMDNGYRYYIHAPDTVPYVASEGYTVSPSTKVSSSITGQSRALLDKKNWGDCISKWPSGYNTTLPYSAGVCQLLCKANYYKRICDCVPYNYNGEHDTRSCTPLEMFDCMRKTLLKYENGRSVYELPDCTTCENECTSSEYTTFNSYAIGFSVGAIKWLHQRNNTWSDEHIKKNFMIISVFFRDLTLTQYSQSKGATLWSMLSNIGSNLGMCFGLSILTIVETVSIFVKLFWIFCSYDRRHYLEEKYNKKHTRERNIDKVIEMYKNDKDLSEAEDPHTQGTVGKLKTFANSWVDKLFVHHDLEPGAQYTTVRNPFYNQRFPHDTSSEDSESDDAEYQTTIQSLANTVAATIRERDHHASTIYENVEQGGQSDIESDREEMLDMKLEKDPENPGGFIAVFPNLPDVSSSDSNSDDLEQGTPRRKLTEIRIDKDMLDPKMHHRTRKITH